MRDSGADPPVRAGTRRWSVSKMNTRPEPRYREIVAWIRSGMHEPPEEMAEIYRFMTTHSMMDLTEEV